MKAAPVPATDTSSPEPTTGRTGRPWRPPVLEALGPWRALTLQQSVGIGPGNFGLLGIGVGDPGRRLT